MNPLTIKGADIGWWHFDSSGGLYESLLLP